MLNTLLMKILFLTVGDERHPSSQVRVYQFLPHFKQAGIICAVEPFLTIKTREKIAPLIASNNIFKIALAGAVIIAAVGKRFKIISSSGDYYAVVVQKDVLPFGLQGFLKRMNPNIIFEFDDAIWELPPDVKKRPAAMRLFYPYKIRLFHAILKKAGIILTNNSYQHNYAKKFNDKVAVITAPIDTGYFAPSDDPSTDKDAIVLGLVGTHGTTYMLESIAGALERIGRKFPYVKFLNIGGYPIELKNMRSEYIPWRNSTILNDLRRIDIGLTPLDDLPINRGRLGYKMVIYMSMGIPFVAQDIGLNKIIVMENVNGCLAITEDEWFDKLSGLIEDKELRQKLGRNGRQISFEKYDIKDAAKKYVNLFYEVIKQTTNNS